MSDLTPPAPRTPDTAVPWLSPVREYRTRCVPQQGECAICAAVDETDLRITLDATAPEADRIDMALTAIRRARGQILNWCALDPAFRTSLSPLAVPAAAPDIVLRMYRAAQKTGVGPFAAVAGAIAEDVALELAARTGSQEVLVENGGDVYVLSHRDRVVGLLPDPASGLIIGIRLPAGICPTALCASSGRIGHSLSFGQGDLAVIRARDAAMADAAATACANMLRTADDVPRMLQRARALSGVTGAFAQCGGRIGLWGMELAE